MQYIQQLKLFFLYENNFLNTRIHIPSAYIPEVVTVNTINITTLIYISTVSIYNITTYSLF